MSDEHQELLVFCLQPLAYIGKHYFFVTAIDRLKGTRSTVQGTELGVVPRTVNDSGPYLGMRLLFGTNKEG